MSLNLDGLAKTSGFTMKTMKNMKKKINPSCPSSSSW